MAAVFSTTETFTSGQKNITHSNLNAIVSGLSVTNIGASEIATDGITAVKVNADLVGAGLLRNASSKAHEVVGYGFETTALTNANQTLARGTNKVTQKYTGTLTGAVVINASRSSAVAGDKFRIVLGDVVTTATNTLTIQENGSGSLVVFNEAKTVTGTIDIEFNGTSWEITLLSVVQS